MLDAVLCFCNAFILFFFFTSLNKIKKITVNSFALFTVVFLCKGDQNPYNVEFCRKVTWGT